MLKTNLTIEEFLPNITGAKKNKWENSFIKEKFSEDFSKPCDCTTIKEYWETFTEPRLPDKDVVLAWHKMLMEYCKMPGAVFAIRGGNSESKHDEDDNRLRRGWLTKTNDDYSYFFTDNDLACIIFKMVLQGYCPDLSDFYKSMTEFKYVNDIAWFNSSKKSKENKKRTDIALNGKKRKYPCMPVHFQKHNKKTEDRYNAMIIKGPTPDIGAKGYKHSHLYSAGQKYILNGKEVSMGDDYNGFFPIGNRTEWHWSEEYSNYIRFQNIPDEHKTDSKNLAVACFLRFVDPLNHFLSPKGKNSGNTYHQYTKPDGSTSNDIAEYDELLCYAQEKMFERYGADVYEEFSKFALTKKFGSANGDIEIHIKYSSKPINKTNVSQQNSAVPAKKTIIAKNDSISNYTLKIGAAAKNIFTSLLEEDRLSPSMIANLRDKQYCRNQEINYYPVLAINGEDSIDHVRYYKDLICNKYYLSSQWFEKQRDILCTWLSDNGFEDKITLLQ